MTTETDFGLPAEATGPRPSAIRRFGLAGTALAAGLLTAPLGLLGTPQERPNFVLISTEDNSVHFLDHFVSGGAKLPNLERLAAGGITFDRAFSNAPVCSVARTTLITGVYGPRIATHNHRRLTNSILPAGWELFPYYLREDGYHTVKNGKKDFNVEEGRIWSRDGRNVLWRSRPDESTPFFYMQAIQITHEGHLHFGEEAIRTEPTIHDPDTVEVFPYLPDTEVTRYSHAYYLDRHLDMDRELGEILDQLEADGLRENTIIMVYADHGGVLPRSKGYIYESGLHVPLVVYIPEKYQHLSPFEPGSRVSGFVDFLDIAPTVLNLAGVGLPSHLDGRPFLGPDVTAGQVNERDETFSYADRFDEKIDMVRTLRKGDFKYMRNYMPFYPDGSVNEYRYRQLAYQQWRELWKAGELNEVQRQFFEPREPEALYDLAADPHETRNLAGDPAYAEVLEELRTRLRLRMRTMPDLGLFPESYLLEHAVENPVAFGQTHVTQVTRLLNVADLALLPFEEARPRLKTALQGDDPWERHWALIVCSAFGEDAAEFRDRARALAAEGEAPVRIRAAEFLGVLGEGEVMESLYEVFQAADNQADAVLALNAMTYLRDHRGYEIDGGKLTPNPGIRRNQLDRRLEYLQVMANE